MKLRIEIDGQASRSLRNLAQRRLPESRKNMVRSATWRTLQQVIESHPVDTGRSAGAWSAALEQLGGGSPASGRGRDPAAIVEGRRQGSATLTEGADQTETTATNSVKYIAFLEYGTSRMAPFTMVRSALRATASTVARLFTLGGPPAGPESP